MALSRKLLTSLAERYSRLRPTPDQPEFELWTKMVAATVTAIEAEIPSFNRDRFFDAATGAKGRPSPGRN
jgi:hypothetical protein